MTAIDDSELDPVDERAVPLVSAMGRMVLAAAALEKVRDARWRDELVGPRGPFH